MNFNDQLHQISPELGELYDQADLEARIAEEANEAELHKELYDCIYRALDECKAKGVSVESLRHLARETGMTTWALENSLKGK